MRTPRSTSWLAGVAKGVHGWGAEELSQGLHASTLCADSPAPWGDASRPPARVASRRSTRRGELSDAELYPYDRETATSNGLRPPQCRYWPPVDVPAPPGRGDLPDVPTCRWPATGDLSTPLEWARGGAGRAPPGGLMIVKGAGHDVQAQGDPKALAAVRRLAVR